MHERSNGGARSRVAGATVAAVVAAVGLAGAAAGSNSASPKVRVALLVPIQANAYTGAYQIGVKRAAAANNATVQIFDSFFSPQKQVAQCQDIVAGRTADAIVIHPIVGSSVVPCVEGAIKAGIKVVALDGPIGPRYDTARPQVKGLAGSVVQTTRTEPPAVARALIAACAGKNPCQVGRLLGVAGFSYDAARAKVIKAAIKRHPNIKIVQEVVYGFDARRALSVTREMLTANPEIDVIESNGGQGALVALSVAKEMGIRVRAISQSGSFEEIKAVREGRLFASVCTPVVSMGRRAAEIAILAARRRPTGEAFVDARSALCPKDVLIRRSNAKQFKAQWSLGPLPTG